ncbi:hypothetical protein N7507_005001 [Penicillium longicatenatum]|nr:hypothetical protein N7507_005001 [Penicillium longicatenatum]
MKNFGPLNSQGISNSNTYTLGQIGQHSIVITCLPAGQYGNTSATTAANNILRMFSKSLRVGFIVGVGGRIPSMTHNIRLGDVVISCPEGTIGGLVQCDLGKVISGGEIQRTGSLNSPPRSLLTAISSMRAAELRDDPRFLDYITNRLFKPEHDHPATANSCDSCLADWEERRNERESCDL